jgi:hypothetical protein
MSEPYKFGVRFFLAGNARSLAEFIPIFHGWIQRKALAGHQLIDVHDYRHVAGGPGILLVAHEANINFDGQSLTYTRKQPAPLAETLAQARQAAKLLELPLAAAPFEVFVNDRLATVTVAQIAAAVTGKVTLKTGDPRERQTFVVHL